MKDAPINRHALLRAACAVALLLAVILGTLAPPTRVGAQDPAAFPEMQSGQRIYDTTGASLAADPVASLEQHLDRLEGVGADVVLYVRALDASPEETLDQVEALQQAWVATTGRNQDNAVAILINRNPDDPNDARAGIYVGSTYDDGNVPRGEQEAIVDDALIPPLRDGDVAGSFSAGLDRLETSILNGPPKGAFEAWAADAGGGWLPWAGVAAALAGLAGGQALFRTRQRATLPEQRPTTMRPGTLPPALAGALTTRDAKPPAIPATILDLAARNALDIEPESEGGTFTKPKIQLRLLDQGVARDEIEQEVWTALEEYAEDGVVSSKDLGRVARQTRAVNGAIDSRMRAEGWTDETSGHHRAWLLLIGIVAIGLAIFGLVVAAVGHQWLPAVAIVALAVAGVVLLVMFGSYSPLSQRGQDAAMPWMAYRDGLKQAAKDESVGLDLDVALPDAVAFNLGTAMNDRLEAANDAGEGLRIFTSATGQGQSMGRPMIFPYWVAYSSTFSSSGSGSSTVSGGGAGGGGGAAGST